MSERIRKDNKFGYPIKQENWAVPEVHLFTHELWSISQNQVMAKEYW